MAFNTDIGQASLQVAVTPNDNTHVQYSYLYVGGAGDVTVVPLALTIRQQTETPVTYANVAAGSFIWAQVSKVMSTGTTATKIVGLGPI